MPGFAALEVDSAVVIGFYILRHVTDIFVRSISKGCRRQCIRILIDRSVYGDMEKDVQRRRLLQYFKDCLSSKCIEPAYGGDGVVARPW